MLWYKVFEILGHLLYTDKYFFLFLYKNTYSVYSLTLVLLNKDAMPTSKFQLIRLLNLDCCYKFIYLMANSADPDQLASSEANWSGSTLFAKAGYVRVQQDKG